MKPTPRVAGWPAAIVVGVCALCSALGVSTTTAAIVLGSVILPLSALLASGVSVARVVRRHRKPAPKPLDLEHVTVDVSGDGVHWVCHGPERLVRLVEPLELDDVGWLEQMGCGWLVVNRQPQTHRRNNELTRCQHGHLFGCTKCHDARRPHIVER